MSNIEDDIKKLNKFNEYENTVVLSEEALYEIQDAIEHILSEREQDKARIKELEEERQLVGMPVKNKRSGKIGIVLHQWESGSIAVLENISPRIINTHDSWDTLEIINDEIKQIKTGSDSIPKQKAKEMQARIKELEDKLQEINGYILTKGIDEPLKTATQIKCEYQKQYIIQQEITRLKQYAKELMKEKQQLTTALLDSIPTQKVKDVLQNNRNEIFSFTYVDDEQFKPYTMQIDRINKIEKELLEEGE